MDESRIWNMTSNWKQNESSTDQSRISYLIGYLENETLLKSITRIDGSSYDFTRLTAETKTSYLFRLTRHLHNRKTLPNSMNGNYLYSNLVFSYVVLVKPFNSAVIRYTDRIVRLFVPKFYHDRKDKNFLKGLVYAGEKKEIDEKNFSEAPLLGRKLYEYRFDKNNQKIQHFTPKDFDWPFPDIWYQSIGFTVSGFTFELKNAPANIKNKLDLQGGLINVENNLENAENSITEGLFFPSKKSIEKKIAEYNAIPTKNFINESYFLYDKSNLIKNIYYRHQQTVVTVWFF